MIPAGFLWHFTLKLHSFRPRLCPGSGGTGMGQGQADGAGRCTEICSARAPRTPGSSFLRPELFLFLTPSRNLRGLKQFPNLGGCKEIKAKNPSFAIPVLRERTKPTTGKCCFFLKYGISFLLRKRKKHRKEKKKIDWHFPPYFFYYSGLRSALASWQEREALGAVPGKQARQCILKQLPGHGVSEQIYNMKPRVFHRGRGC